MDDEAELPVFSLIHVFRLLPEAVYTMIQIMNTEIDKMCKNVIIKKCMAMHIRYPTC